MDRLPIDILPQPDDTACGPTCLHAVYRYYGETLSLESVVNEVTPLDSGGTLAVHLARHALGRGYRAKIYTYNLHIFDPTWFDDAGVDLRERLREQARLKADPSLRAATDAYLDYLARGGQIGFEPLRFRLIREHLERGRPILTGLSATYLYGCARETGDAVLEYDDVLGVPVGHFVVLCGCDRKRREVLVADPTADNPRFESHLYTVGIDRLVAAILLGVITYDANLLLIEPAKEARG
ncbi:MAG: hypothetical protein JSU66_10200 [Deltaproteobacteria bacterium]|nr:MAG: hypothetical protein JSU66_10200 [Deltaproteobacteria bacterium]